MKKRYDDIIDFIKLTKKKSPNKEIQYYLINIVYSSCLMYRVFNGDVELNNY